ncbi:MAG: 50S ribosomal protein L24 [Oscillospiraceae bacterium]|nr:50S ribosomal protein L24 [Oscillospiraceae bacterium]
MKIKKNDTVVVLSGKDKGKQGKVLSTMPTVGKVLVEGVNMADCHVKPTRQGQEGGIIRKAIPLRASKVMVVCPKCGKPTRCGYKILEDGSKTRFCSGKRGCGETF